MRTRTLLPLLLANFCIAPAVLAHNKVPMEEDTCVVRMGKYSVHFTAYQFGSGTEYCWDLPAAGKNILVFDFLESKMRHMKTEVEVVEGNAGEPGGEHVVAHLEPQTYPAGTLSVETNLEDGKAYYAKLTLDDTKPIILKAPLHIGAPKDPRYLYAAGGAALLALVGGLVLFLRRRQTSFK
jgi:hypothetical protein